MISDEQLDLMTIDAMRELNKKLSDRIHLSQQQKKGEAIESARTLIASFGIEAEDIFGKNSVARTGRKLGPAVPKYRDPKTGLTWAGRGRTPVWLVGKNLEDFKIV